MPKNKKKWIDKKNAVTFHLVHRSQQDPLAADETAPQRVLLASGSTQDKPNKKKDEERKYGIYFDDDYDYLQHLREVGTQVAHWEQAPEKPAKEQNIKLPSSVFASEVEEDVGLLNRAAPRSGLNLDLDPDIVAAMDEDFDFDDPDNQLEDDFVLQANVSGDESFCDEDDEFEDASDVDEDEDTASSGFRGRSEDEMDDLASLNGEETKSRFTEFSMSSSVVPRNDQLTLLDDRFEKMFAEYDEHEIGPLDSEEIEGELNPVDDMILRLADEEYDKRSKVPDPEASHIDLSDSECSSIEDERLLPLQEKERWDCESILSTYSTLYNHPKLITEPKTNKIKINPRTGMPIEDNRLTARNLATLGGSDSKGPGSVISALSQLSIRNKDESAEEKKKRKATLKQYRRDRRVERKLNKEAFKDEKKRQEKNQLNTRVTNVAVHL